MARNTKMHRTRMKLFTQPAILETCQKSINSFSLKVSPCTKNEAVCLKSEFKIKLYGKLVQFYANIPTR